MKNLEHVDFVPIGKCVTSEQHSADAPVILVISPHPDDDVIGMGGAMRLFADEGKQVFSVYVTDGSSGCGRNRGASRVRRSEALAALKIVRASGAFFLPHASSALTGKARCAVVRQLRTIIALLQPNELYLPSPFERHPTHRRTTSITLQAVKAAALCKPELWGYSVWGGIYGLPGTKTIDITRYLRIKRKAIRQHASQMECKPYDRGILGRNAYEGIFLHTHGGQFSAGAETFISLQRLKSLEWTDGLIRAIAAGTHT